MIENQTPSEIWLATTNKGKVHEIRILLEKQWPEIKIKTLADLPVYTPPPETGKTFKDNAHIKARSLKAMKPEAWILAEDSGLEVTALGNLPGVHSARYAGDKASDSENVSKVVKMLALKGAQDRSARFVCHLTVINAQNEVLDFEGFLKGQISKKVIGLLGFGYDPVFIPEGEEKTLGELGPGFKTRKSHRAEALQQFMASFS